LLSRYEQITQIEILNGSVTITGPLFLTRLPNLKRLYICTQEHDLISQADVEEVLKGVDSTIRGVKLSPVVD
jgi:hypothetical protein